MSENKELVLEKQKRRYQFILEVWKTVCYDFDTTHLGEETPVQFQKDC